MERKQRISYQHQHWSCKAIAGDKQSQTVCVDKTVDPNELHQLPTPTLDPRHHSTVAERESVCVCVGERKRGFACGVGGGVTIHKSAKTNLRRLKSTPVRKQTQNRRPAPKTAPLPKPSTIPCSCKVPHVQGRVGSRSEKAKRNSSIVYRLDEPHRKSRLS